jgi:hypothetical protein
MQGNRGSFVVLGLFACVALISAMVMAGFVFFTPESVPCASGDESLNPRDAQSRVLERRETFQAVEDGERFICHRVPHLRDVEGWHLREVEALRTNDLARVVEGLGFAAVYLRYTNQEQGANLQLDVTPQMFDQAREAGETTVEVGGDDATVLVRDSGEAVVRWRRNDLDIIARSQLNETWTLPRFLETLQQVR